jgi:hypothetical protein
MHRSFWLPMTRWDGKAGEHVWAKGPHRDGRRSTRNHVSIKWGHKWLVMCVLVKLPGIDRPWALPILCGLCCTEKVAKQTGYRRKRWAGTLR